MSKRELGRIVVGLLALVIVWNILITLRSQALGQTLASRSSAPREMEHTAFSNEVTQVVDASRDKVVTVLTYTSSDESDAYGLGSGVLYKQVGSGYFILTNHHVIADDALTRVRLDDGTELDAEIIGSDAYAVVAVLSIETERDLQLFTIAHSGEARVGTPLIAIGSPVDEIYANTVTYGVLSGSDRRVAVDIDDDGREDILMNLIQTDAAVNPGNSGGALVDMDGNLVGIVALKFKSVTIQGMGFAIPVSEVLPIIEVLERGESLDRPRLGVVIQTVADLDSLSRDQRGVSDSRHSGVIITTVLEESVAAAAGILINDIVLSFDGKQTSSNLDLMTAVLDAPWNQEIPVLIERRGEIIELKVVFE